MSLMKRLFLLIYLVSCCSIVNAQDWTIEQISKANTANDIPYLSNVEKDAIKYINLCRLYPEDFLFNELITYLGTKRYGFDLENSEYRKSLMVLLRTMKPVHVLNFDIDAYNNAKCFAKEQGEAGTLGHERINCPMGNYAECCSYGMDTGLDIAMQWLIDDNIASLGHRNNCLNGDYSKIGLSVNFHKIWHTCAIADMIWESSDTYLNQHPQNSSISNKSSSLVCVKSINSH